MLEAHAGQGDFPRVRTFRQLDSSTNNVFDDLKEAERWTGVQGKVDMAELTWEQRERILRLMFAKMNGFKEKRFDVCLSYSLWQFLFVFFFFPEPYLVCFVRNYGRPSYMYSVGQAMTANKLIVRLNHILKR